MCPRLRAILPMLMIFQPNFGESITLCGAEPSVQHQKCEILSRCRYVNSTVRPKEALIFAHPKFFESYTTTVLHTEPQYR
jgi:hypothetical protein